MKRFLANRAPGVLTQRTTRGIFQRPIRTLSNATANNQTPRWG